MQIVRYCLVVFVAAALQIAPVHALPPETVQSVVSVLPVWPDKPQGGPDVPPGTAPEGSGIVVDGDASSALIATAWHVIKPAERIDVQLRDGRIVPAEVVGHDAATDIALLRVDADLAAFEPAPRPQLGQRVCAVANAYGLGLSVSCGVVSALDVSDAGFNPVEDFVQTDAAANPGSSGGALVDEEGRLVGMMAAIFAAKSDTNIGINFAISAPLLERVVEDLRDDGTVERVSPGWRLSNLSREAQAEVAGVRVVQVAEDGVASGAGVEPGDIIQRIGPRRIQSVKDAIAALALVRPGEKTHVTLLREGERRQVTLSFGAREARAATEASECPHPEPVCAVRAAVFRIKSFDPEASAVRIAPDLLVTNRHVVGDRADVTVFTSGGELKGRVVPSAYRGDLALVQVKGLPRDAAVLDIDGERATADASRYYAVGADANREKVRVFAPGKLNLGPSDGAPFGRVHVSAAMRPGVSGGALVDETGRLVGIVVGGGEGRNEAMPVREVVELLALRDAAEAGTVQAELGGALVRCAAALDEAEEAPPNAWLSKDTLASIREDCRASENPGQFLRAGRLLATAGERDAAIAFMQAAVDRVPHSLNARISLLVALQLAGRFEQMVDHARWVMEVLPADPQALRFAIQAGVWGGDNRLAETAYGKLKQVDPRQAEAARRFIDNAPPAPRPR
ncbi:trypsin-like peptidase domain-containing protein [Dichotomicrobium thermohalophilum]|uniref:S1-C subfamily serine protease n=1 Tax=Dichotomicrobium thermohalophilum TaxID=933063 RepID=A0A397Q6G6_9HYPH|nr:trypsin-like peptidase domain-containing protein [Dichotomicrobium thermohalophilum]RIA56856.1 S1-C subfamily serine protease [Dichotomicrobium thermohalophilum]